MFVTEKYVGAPLDYMNVWTSGGKMRRDSQVFGSTNQGITEGMTGHRDPPYYQGPWNSNYDYSSAGLSGDSTKYTTASTTKTEGFNGGLKIDQATLMNQLY